MEQRKRNFRFRSVISFAFIPEDGIFAVECAADVPAAAHREHADEEDREHIWQYGFGG